MDLKRIFENNEKWVQQKLDLDKNYFKRLSEGQSPEFLYIGCSDSRATAEELMGLTPGEVFVHRNIANQVISIDNNVNAVIQFAIDILKVKHIVVCGHYECGGIKAVLQRNDLGELNSWLSSLRDVYRFHQKELEAITQQERKYDRLVEINVLEQCLNLTKIDHVQHSWSTTGLPRIHGWVFNVRTGKLEDLNFDIEREFSLLRNIYELNQKKTSD
ncbi:MAG: carbonic anhydrase [Bacteroidia bacterium]|nr:carbonic anhydrase [Bacteroidia bacterium]MCZ2277496.1 carbonic anhydrase [Bacteroidia bacterium]